MNFIRAVDIVLELENGYNLDPDDPGGATKFGISQRSYPNLKISEVTREQAVDIYKKDFWDRYSIEMLPDYLRLVFFDACVNQGGSQSVQMLQHVLTVEPDGILGPKTLDRISNFSPSVVLGNFTLSRFQHYIDNKNFHTFGIGWLKRLLQITLKGNEN